MTTKMILIVYSKLFTYSLLKINYKSKHDLFEKIYIAHESVTINDKLETKVKLHSLNEIEVRYL